MALLIYLLCAFIYQDCRFNKKKTKKSEMDALLSLSRSMKRADVDDCLNICRRYCALFVNYLQQRVAINKPTLINLLMRYAVEYGFNINKSDGTILKAICKRCLL
jgi:hypothetical protein